MTHFPGSVWLAYQGCCVKAAPDQCRPASEEEGLALSDALARLAKAKAEMDKPMTRGYADITGDERPPTDGGSGEDGPPKRRPTPSARQMAEDRRPTVTDEADACRRRLQKDDGEELEDAVALYGAVRNRSGKEVVIKHQTPADQERFLRAAAKEWSTIAGLGAAKALSPQESEEVRGQLGGRIMKSRWCKTRKPVEQVGTVDPDEVLDFSSEGQYYKAKMRWVARGDEDPDLMEVEASAPAASRDGMMVALQIMVIMGWTLNFCDFTQAFCHGDPLQREGERLFCEQPVEGVPGLLVGQLFELLKHVYGLPDGPLKWNEHLDRRLRRLGYLPSALDLCVYFLHVSGQLQGVIIFSTDDMMHGGGFEHERRMEQLRGEYKFGLWAK